MISAVIQRASAVTIGNVIALTVTALTFTHLFNPERNDFFKVNRIICLLQLALNAH